MKTVFNSHNRYIFIILFLAFVLRLGYVISFGNKPPVTHDGIVFNDVAMNIVQKGQFRISPDSPEHRIVFYKVKNGYSWKAPLYPFFLAIIYKLFGYSFIAVRVMQALIGVFTVLLTYIIGLRFFNRIVGLISSFVVATYPPFIEFTPLFLREILLVCLSAILVFYLMKISHSKVVLYKDYIYIGILLGAIALLKAIILFFIPFFLIALLFKLNKIKPWIKTSVVTLAMMSLVILPWTVRNYKVHHKFVLITTNGGVCFLVGNNPNATGTTTREGNITPWPTYTPEQERLVESLSEADMDRQFFKWGIMYVCEDPVRYFKLAIKKFLIFWLDSYGSYKTAYGVTTRCFDAFLLIAGFFGILYSAKRWRKYLLIYSFIVSITLLHMIFFVVVRNRFPIVPILALFASYGVTVFPSVFYSLESVQKNRRLESVAIFIFTGLAVFGYIFYHLMRKLGGRIY